MKTKDLEKYFGGRRETLAFLAKAKPKPVSRQSYSWWCRNGIPHGKQCWLQIVTKGKLVADEKD